jgi:hypothetical protein
MAAYEKGNLDDKAVHYYSAARLYADRASVHAIQMAEPSWLGRLNPDKRYRMHNRLASYANYAIPDSLLRLLCAARPGTEAPASFTIPVKRSFLLLFLVTLGWLIVATRRHPTDALLVAACLMLAACGTVPHALAPRSDPSMAFMIYVPRGSATILILIAFACFSRGRGTLAGISLLLAAGWHAGLAVVTVPCALLAFGLTLCDRADSRYIRIMLAALVVLGSLYMVRSMPDPTLPSQVWIPAGFMILFLLAGAQITHPALRASASLAAFLFLTLAVSLALQHPPVLNWLVKVTGNQLIGELPVRLTAIRHLAAIALPLVAVVGLLDRFLPDLFPERERLRALLILATLGLAWAGVAGHAQWPKASRTLTAFLLPEEGKLARQTPTTRELATLDPRQETAFFSALGDYLLTGPHPEPD